MDEDVAIKVAHVSKTFRLPHEKHDSLKSVFLSVLKASRTFERQQVLTDINFEIKKGEFFGIVGRNGQGKSTLLKLLAGIYAPNKGAIQVNGKLTPFIELGVGFNPNLTGRENVFLNGALLGFNRKEMEKMYPDIVEFAELDRFMDQKLKNYSSGMQVRLAFSIAIRARSDILLIDEVLAVGDAAFQQKCFDYFEELKARKQTVVFVSHDMASVRRFCTKAVYIKGGKIVYEGDPSKVADEYIEENIEDNSAEMKNTDKEERLKLSKAHKLTTTIKHQDASSIIFAFQYVSDDTEPMYIGSSIVKDGVSVAEITTPLDMPLTKSGKLEYSLDLSLLNGGIYQFTSVLCRMQNRQLLNVGSKNRFVIKGSDPMRGAVLKLADTWRAA